ncbi:MAG TPA: ABC transporter substrate-binding protein [Anaerolineae bacterium]|nr:ABC transporter substrate-binding protein [Anaerolineae bacterium]
MARKLFALLSSLVVVALVLVACAPPTPAPTEAPKAEVPTEAPATEQPTEAAPAVEETAPEGATPPPGYEGKTWADILAEARGQTVNWYMWGGSDTINAWVTGYVADNLKERYGVNLNMVPVSDATEFVNKVLGEKQAGKDTGGSVDIMWINGENFRTMRQADLLYGPWAQFLPNTIYVNWKDPSVANDFGFPVEGYESPYGKAQFVMIYDSAKVPEPPATIDNLFEWIKANPGKFTYPAPPDFTGSVFVRHICYWATGGYEQFLGDFNQELFDEKMPACWKALNDIEPYLWRKGQTYPENHTRLQDLFANGEVYFDMSYGPASASNMIAQGRYPETTRTFVFDTGTIANTHYVAIAYNSPHKAGAMVLANFLLSPEAQLNKAHPDVWGDMPAIDPALLSPEWQQKFNELPRGVATLPPDVLAAHRLPELQSPWLIAIEKGWEENVLKK